MVKEFYIAGYGKAIITFFDSKTSLPFLSKSFTTTEERVHCEIPEGYRHVDNHVDVKRYPDGKKYVVYHVTVKKVITVNVDGVPTDIEDVCFVDNVPYLKTDERVVFSATENEYILRSYAKDNGYIIINNKWYDPDDEDIVYVPDRETYYLKDDCAYCERCEEWHYGLGYTVYVDSNSTEEWCRECANDHAFRCDHCGNYYSDEDFNYETVRGGDIVCSLCLEDNYYWCEECEQYVYYDDYNTDAGMCDRCYNDRHRRVRCYHDSHGEQISYFSHGEKVEFNRDLKVFGFELEVDDGDDADSVIEEIEELDENRLIRSFEHDGSLSDGGFETISHPMDIHTFKAANWEDFLQCYKDYDFRSDEARNSCSLHIHFNRTAFFGYSVRSQENAVAKLYVFFRKYWIDLVKASRRRNLEWCDLDYDIKDCNPELSIVQRQAEYCAKHKKSNNHHTAINQGNRDTIEIRLGKGTLNPKSFRAWIDLMYHVMNNIRKIPFARAHEGALWLKGIEPETKEYLRKRKAFLSIIGTDEVIDVNDENIAVAVAEPYRE